MLASLWSQTAARPLGTGAAAGYQALFETLRRLVVGRRLSVALGRGTVDVTLTVTEFEAQLDMRSLSVGQLNDVRIVAENIVWSDHTLDRASATLRNAHLRPSLTPVLVAAPVEVSLEMPIAIITDLLKKSAPWLVGEVLADDMAQLRWARRPAIGGLDVIPRIDGSTVWLKPRALSVRAKRWGLPQHIPAYPVGLPELPFGLRLTEAHLTPDAIRLSGVLPEWRMEVPRHRLEDIISQLNVVGRQPMLTWWGHMGS
jgi:hypothetical protein